MKFCICLFCSPTRVLDHLQSLVQYIAILMYCSVVYFYGTSVTPCLTGVLRWFWVPSIGYQLLCQLLGMRPPCLTA